ncbi:cobalamin receptor [[Actinobacillus] muris]|uniref:Cobalamin receptor n=1 Tax=Muribacter muris TaxID=67855 RepID=A0A0J5P830_9PAST|nr:TonB-dependent receptor [Muribacter muris]KMK52381.1 cobalamin receptor [[Actinobacillus] muris] [Muribacter muris]
MYKNLITTALLLSLPHLAAAQTALEPINVYSAYAAPVNQDKTASSVTVLTEKEFTARNATYVSDVLKTVPGAAFIAYGGRGTLTNLYLRGANTNQVAVVIDGVKMSPVDNMGFNFGGLPLSNIDRIEVLRGEQSALWGSDAMGGVIYITTKSGLYQDKGFNLDVDLGTGSHRTRDASATLSGHQNGFYYALHGDSHRTRGISAKSTSHFHYQSVTGTHFQTGGAVEKDRFHKDNASLKIGFDDGKKGVELLTNHASQTFAFDNSINHETRFDDNSRIRETLFKLSGYVGGDDDIVKQKVSVSHLKTDSDTTSVGHSAYDAKKLNANYQLDIHFDREGDITQAVSLLGEYQKADYLSSNYNGAEKKLIEKSIAAEYRLFSQADHSLAISGRFTDNDRYQNAWTGRIAGAYRVSPHLKAHASLGTAIQNPTITDYFGYFGTYQANPTLKPAKSLGGDLGVLLESSDKAHSLDLTYFARNVKQFISANSTYTQSINLDGTTQIKGVEIAYTGKFSQTLSGFANYTYTNAHNSQKMALPMRPKHTANAGLSYQITDKLGSNVSLSYVGKRIDTYPHRTKMPSYTLVNVGVNYQLVPSLNVYANLNNLFDKQYENHLDYGQDGRNIYVGLKGSF